MVSRALREYKELQVPPELVQQEPRVLLELLAQLALMVPQVLQELVLLELLVYKVQLGPVVPLVLRG